MVFFLLKVLQTNFRGEKGGNFMVGPARHLASLRHWFYSPVITRILKFLEMNCCVVALSLFSSDILTWSADSLYSVQ